MGGQSSYLQLERDLSRVRHLDSLESILDKAGVDRSDIMLYGSSIMALCGIRQNDDLEFIPHPKHRKTFEKLAEDMSEAHINEKGQIFFPNNIHSSWPDRFIMFGWDDTQLFDEDRFYIIHDGYKFLRLELLLSIKGTLRRPKDFEDFSMLEEGDYIGGPGWNWELVRRVPPWDRPETPSNSILELATHSIRERGVMKTGLRAPTFFATEFLNMNVDILGLSRIIRCAKEEWRLDSEISRELERHYPAPDLLNRQFEDGRFIRDDLIAAVLAVEGEEIFQSYRSNLTEPTPSITPDGSISEGLLEMANRLASWQTTDCDDLPQLTFPVGVNSENQLPPRGQQWAADTFGATGAERIIERRQELLANVGVYFYAILWPLGLNHHDEIESWLSERLDIVFSESLDLGDDIEDFAHAIYSTDKRPFEWEKIRKVKNTSSEGSTVRVVTIRIPNPNFRSWNGPRISDTIYEIKQECRREFQGSVEDYEYGALIHTTDNYQHNAHISRILTTYSPND